MNTKKYELKRKNNDYKTQTFTSLRMETLISRSPVTKTKLMNCNLLLVFCSTESFLCNLVAYNMEIK